MARYRKVDPLTWKDRGFSSLDTQEKLVALYIITAQSNRIGIFPLSPGEAAEDLGLSVVRCRARVRHVCRTLKWEWDEAARVIYLPTWWKYNPPENPSHLIGSLRDVEGVPASPLLARFWANSTHLPEGPVRQAFLTRARHVCHTCATGAPHQELELELELELEQELKLEQEGGVGEGAVRPSASPVVEELTFWELPNRDDGQRQVFPVTEEMLAVWRKAYPAIDVLAEIRKASAFAHSNPPKRKTHLKRFVNGWLSRAQERPRSSVLPAAEPERPSKKAPDPPPLPDLTPEQVEENKRRFAAMAATLAKGKGIGQVVGHGEVAAISEEAAAEERRSRRGT